MQQVHPRYCQLGKVILLINYLKNLGHQIKYLLCLIFRFVFNKWWEALQLSRIHRQLSESSLDQKWNGFQVEMSKMAQKSCFCNQYKRPTDLQTNKAPVCHTVFQTASKSTTPPSGLCNSSFVVAKWRRPAPARPRRQKAVRGAAHAAVAQGSFCTKLRAARARIDALMCTTSSFFPRRPPALACPSLPQPGLA